MDEPTAKRPCADFSLRELLLDPAFYLVVVVFLYAAAFTVVMYGPALLWGWWRKRWRQ